MAETASSETIARWSARQERVPISGLPGNIILPLLVACAYFAGTKLGLLLTPPGQPISTLWPPNAILLAALFLASTRRWPFFLLAVLPVHMLVQLKSGIPAQTSLGWYFSNISEALLGASCLRAISVFRNIPPRRLLETLSGIFYFVLFGALLAPLVTSFLDVGIVVGTGWGSAGDYWTLWRGRFLSNMLAILTLVPAIVLFGSLRSQIKARQHGYLEALLLAAGMVLTIGLLFGRTHAIYSVPGLMYLLLPFLLWAAVRFGSGGASISLLLVALFSIWNAIHYGGPFGLLSTDVLSLQIFLGIINVPLLALTAVLQERREIENVLRENQHLLNLVSEIAATFVNVGCEEIDERLTRSLERIRTFLQVSRVSIFEFRGSEGFCLCYSAFAPDLSPPPAKLHVQDPSWAMSQLQQDKLVCINDVYELPADSRVRESLTEFGIRSIVAVPFGAEGSLAGILNVVSIDFQKSWPSDLVPQLRVLGGIFYDAMQRKKAIQALTESELRFRHTADHAPMMVWMSGVDGGCNYFNQGWLDFTGCELQGQLGDGWTRCIHEDDMQECLSLYKFSFDARRRFQMEYRLRRHDNEFRWILDIGVPRFNSEGVFLGFIGSAIDITERKKAEAAVIGFGGKLINAQDEERRRIARDLHDDVGQRLALIAIGLDRLHDGVDSVPQHAVEDLLNQVNEISDCVRDLSRSLHSAGLDLLPLGTAMGALCREFPHRSSVAVQFFEQDVPPSLPQDVKLCFYRVAQEALQNIAKHSEAQVAAVSLVRNAERLFLTINDDGMGFTMDQHSGLGLGLASMRERLRLVGGSIKITSAPMRGTTIEASVPLYERSSEVTVRAA